MKKIPLWETHWFQLSDHFLVELKDNLLQELIQTGIKKAGNLYLLTKQLGFSAPTFYDLINQKGVKMISVAKLKALLDYLNIEYCYLNNKIRMTKKGSIISIDNPKFPINLNNKEGTYLLGLIVSDGCIFLDKDAGVFRTKYAAGEKQSVDNFVNTINKLYGKVHIQEEFVRNCTILRIGSSIIGDSLLKVGAIAGNKTAIDGELPWLIQKGTKEMKASYLRAIFDDEACVYNEKTRNCGYITLSRYRHLNNLTEEQKEELDKLDVLMSEGKFPTGHIRKSIPLKKAREILKDSVLLEELKRTPKILQAESKLLNEFGIDTRLFGRYLTKTHLGRYSLCFDLFINRKESLKNFYKHIGFSLDRKQQKLLQLVGGDHDNKALQHTDKRKGKI